MIRSVAALAVACLLATSARADDSAAAAPDKLGWNNAVDLPLTLTAAAFWLGSEATKSKFAPDTCRFCEPNSFDWRIRNAVVWDNPKTPQKASDILLFGGAPAAAIATTLILAGHDDKLAQSWVDVGFIAESIALASATNQIVKFAVARRRPFANVLSPAERLLIEKPEDSNLSFYSGHSAATFSLAASTITVAHMRGYRWAKWAWIASAPIAFATAYLRMAGDKHYFTDVLTGALMGTATGIFVPALHDWAAFRGAKLQPVVSPGAVGVATVW